MKILLMGDASNCHAALAVGLRRLGHEVTVASDGSRWMNTPRDIDLSRHPSKIGGAILWLKLSTVLASRLRGYDVVSITNPVFVRQRPGRVATLFDRLRRDNGAVFLTALGTDRPYLDLCRDPDSPLPYSEWRLPDGEPAPYALTAGDEWDAWHTQPLMGLNDKVYREIDGAVSVLYEYDLACRWVLPAEKVAYGGIPIVMSEALTGSYRPSPRVKMLLGRHRGRMAEKGTDKLEEIAREVVKARPDRFALDIVEDLPYAEYVERLRGADVVLDQLYSQTPATNALLAMACGQIAVSGAEEAYYDFIGETENRPIINAIPGREYECVKSLLALGDDPDLVARLKRDSYLFVKKHNDCEVVARRFAEFWTSRLTRL